MTPDEAVAKLHAIREEYASDPEQAHEMADDVLLAMVGPQVEAAHSQLVAACAWWVTA